MHRKLMRYTASQVAHMLELQTTSQLSQWERGIRLPTAENLIKLSFIYRTYPNELYLEYFQELKTAVQQREFELLNN